MILKALETGPGGKGRGRRGGEGRGRRGGEGERACKIRREKRKRARKVSLPVIREHNPGSGC
jgi:hypothetical protein